MTKEEAKHLITILQAYVEGKTIELNRGQDTWEANSNWDFNSSAGPLAYRIKPEPKLRPWKSEEVPVGCLLRSKRDPNWRSVLICQEPKHSFPVRIGHSDNKGGYDYLGLLNDFEHSLDQGKTWLPCGVQEEE